jgi:outer membrane immunogenic protein
MRKLGWKSAAAALAALPLIASHSQAGERRVDVAAYGPAWAGFYVGAHAGLAFRSVEISGPVVPFGGRIEDDSTDLFGGVQVGYNFLMSSGLLLGVEGDWSFLNGDVATLRGRLGQVIDDKLFYATAGLAFADDDVVDATGLVVGAGVEVDLDRYWKNVTAGVEGLYYTASDEVSCGRACNIEADVSSFAIRGRVNYHFGGNDGQLK